MKKSLLVNDQSNFSLNFNPYWGWAATIAALVLVMVAVRYALPLRDGDTWYHILYGRYFWENKTLIANHTIFSWTPSLNKTIYCAWLSELFFFFYHKVTGLTGLIIFRYFCIYLLVFACYFFSKRLKITGHPVTWLICLLAVLMSYTAIIAKPEIFSYVFMILLAWNWWHLREAGTKAWKKCYFFPLIMLIWVNSHGGFIFGVVFLFFAGIGEVLNIKFSPSNVLPSPLRKHFLASMFLTIFSLFINPYGYHYLAHLVPRLLPTNVNIVSGVEGNIGGFASPFGPHEHFGLLMLFIISVGLLTYFYARNIRNIEFSSLLLNLVFAFLYTCFFRTTFYWVPVFLFSSLTLLTGKPLVPSKCKMWVSTLLLPALTLGLAIIISGVIFRQALLFPEMDCWLGFGIEEQTPVAEAKYIKKYFPTARIGNTYNQGPYLLWEIWPDNKVFVDTRQFPYKGWLEEYFKIFNSNVAADNPEKFAEFIDKYSCDLWLIGHENILARQWFFLSPDWQIAFYGKCGVIFARKDISLPVEAPVFSPDLNTISNLLRAIEVLKWTLIIRDRKAANIVISRLEKHFTYPSQRKTTQKLILLARFLEKENKGLTLRSAKK